MSVGAIAQLGERLHGMQEVSGSIPLSSTNSNPRRQAGVFLYIENPQLGWGFREAFSYKSDI
jgi:hypothetical protein